MTIKIPESMRIGCFDYSIQWVDEIDGECMGMCSEARGEILLSRKDLKTEDQILLTFLHEVIHAILCQVDYDYFLAKNIDPYEFNEYLTNNVSRILLQVIKDNCHEKTGLPTCTKGHKDRSCKKCSRK